MSPTFSVCVCVCVCVCVQEDSRDKDKSFYLSTAALMSAFSTEASPDFSEFPHRLKHVFIQMNEWMRECYMKDKNISNKSEDQQMIKK